jgi:exodeoxyribonuclease-1
MPDMSPKSLVLFDLETTGLERRYDQPVQFAAIRLDANLGELDNVNWLARPQKHIIPAPAALATHGRGIDQILSAPLSHYELMTLIEELAIRWAPAIWLGFNSLRYDDEIVRYNLYAALRQPYAMQYHGNSRADVMQASRLASVLDPGSINVPRNGGKATFKLELLAPANGFSEHDAHDALGDARAAAHMLRIIAVNAPSTWALLSSLVNKHTVVELLQRNEFVIVVEHFGTAVARPVVPICPNPEYPTEWLAIDVTSDPAALLGLGTEDLANAFAQQKRQLCRLRTNAMPLIVPATLPGASRLLAANIAPDVPARAQLLHADRGFGERLNRAAALGRREYPKAANVEDRLYEGGFFPLGTDQDLIHHFHAADPEDKLAVLHAMQDDRARQLGLRVMYNEWPDVLPADERAAMDRDRLARLNASEGPWTSISKALVEIDKLLPNASPETARILQDYRRYFRSLAVPHAA